MDFLSRLSQNNNREWFNANKREYQEVKCKVEMLATQLITAVSAVDSEASRLTPSQCTYRIYRDTRFSPDKTPYKTHIGIFINPPFGKKSMTCGYYFHLEPGKSLMAAGTVCLPSKVVTAIRRSIYDEIDEYRKIVESEEFKRYFPELGGNKLKTAPKGFDKTWEWIEYLRPKDFMAAGAIPDTFFDNYDLTTPVISEDNLQSLLPVLLQMKKYNAFINYTIEGFIDSE